MRNSSKKSKLQEQKHRREILQGNQNSRNKTSKMLEMKKSMNQIKTVENITSRLNQAKEYRGQEPAQKKYYIHITVIKKKCPKHPRIHVLKDLR